MKVGFVGAGTIGANSIYATLALTDRIDEIAVVDIAEDPAVGRALVDVADVMRDIDDAREEALRRPRS